MAMARDVKAELETRKIEDLLAELLFESIPYVFNNDREQYRLWRDALATRLQVDPCEIVIIGSAATGFSLTPSANFREFNERSDVDIAIISERHFSEMWHYLRGVDLTLASIKPAQRAAIESHRTNYIYWGCIATDRILAILPFAAEWVAIRNDLSATRPTEGRQINRIYKDFRALRGYQLRCLKMLKSEVISPKR